MTEKEFEMLLADYLGGEMDAAERRRFEEYLEANPEARAEAEALRQTLADVQGLGEVTESQVAAYQGSRRRGGWVTRALRYAAVLAIGVGLGWLLKPAKMGPHDRKDAETVVPARHAATDIHPDWIKAGATASKTYGQRSSLACHLSILAAMKREG